jgi:hypothetical protein
MLYRTLKRRVPEHAREEWRQRLSAACAAHIRLGQASLVLYESRQSSQRPGCLLSSPHF